MLTIGSSGVKIYLHTGKTDMRKGVNGLSLLANSIVSDALSCGALFVFRGTNADKIKILYWDGQGFCLFYKCLNSGKFTWPKGDEKISVGITSAQLSMLLEGIDWRNPQWSQAPKLQLAENIATFTEKNYIVKGIESIIGEAPIIKGSPRDLLATEIKFVAESLESLPGKAMAGAITVVPIKDIQRLTSVYGGEAADWVKMTSKGNIDLMNKIAIKGNRTLQIHWYENIKTGQKS